MQNLQLEPISKELLVAGNSSAMFTPDLLELERRERHLVFIYNELQKKHWKHHMIEDQKYMGTMFTYERYQLFKRKLKTESIPIMLDENWPKVEKLRVKGEVWSIDTATLIHLDDYMLNTVEYHRQRIELIYPHKKVWVDKDGVIHRDTGLRHSIHMAWCYVGDNEYWNALLDGGFFFGTCRQFKGDISFALQWTDMIDIRNYYAFSLMEYSD